MTLIGDDADRRALARVGRVLKEKWTLQELIGIGGMAAVYAAKHRAGKRFAVKILHNELSAVPEIRRRFLREAYVANKVDHPNAVSVLDDDEDDDGAVFLVMELVEGETVQARAERVGTMPPAEVLTLADGLLDVLAAAHDKGIVHRDIKPENLILTKAGALKVLDFGVARLREADDVKTIAGSMLGTPAYMPPEQARGRLDDIDARTDLWAVGATMFALLSGQLVRQEGTLNELLAAAMTLPAKPLLSVAPSMPLEVAAIVDKALAFNKADRFSDARSMQLAVRQALPAAAQWVEVRAEKVRSIQLAETVIQSDSRRSPFADLPAEPMRPRRPAEGEGEGAAGLANDSRRRANQHYVWGIELSEWGRNDAAIHEYDQAITHMPTHAPAHNARSVARLALGDNEGALEDASTALDLSPRLGDASFNRALVWIRLGDMKAAASDALAALAIYDSEGDADRRAAALALVKGLGASPP